MSPTGMLKMNRSALLLLMAAGLAACATHDAPLAPPPGAPAAPLSSVGIACRADVRGGTVACGGPESGGARGDVIVGGQRQYVTLSTSNVAYDAASGDLTFSTTVTSLIPQPMGTEDGVRPTVDGVRVFFAAEPAVTELGDPRGPANVDVVPDGYELFTASNQPYFEYPGYLLGADNILTQGETSSAKTWKIHLDPNVLGFVFTVYVWTRVPQPGGYVDVGPAAWSMAVGDTATLAATVRSAVGSELPGRTVAWESSNPSVAEVDEGGRLTARGVGVATVTARDGERAGTAEILVMGPSSEQYRTVSAGGAASCALTVSRSLFCMGGGTMGLLGNGEFVMDLPGPVRVLDEPWDTVSVGFLQACALKAGAAWCWGQDRFGTLGTGALLPPCRTQYGSSSYGCSNRPLPVAGGLTFTRITAAGNDLQGNVGPPYAMFACGLASGGAAWCWGGDGDGELGDGAQHQPLDNPAPRPVAGGLIFAYVASGFDGSCALTAAGKAYCWGDEKVGEMGDDEVLEEVLDRPTPVQGGLSFRQIDTGRSNSCGVTTGGEVYCWGANDYGMLGTDQPVPDCRMPATSPYPRPCSPAPVKVALPEGVEFVRATVGLTSACALSAGGRIWCWGEATGAGAGDPRKIPGAVRCISFLSDRCLLRPVPVASSYRFVDLDTAAGSHCAISTTRQWLCWPFRPLPSRTTFFVPTVVPDPVS